MPLYVQGSNREMPSQASDKIASYATETANMTSDAKLGEELKKLAHEANTFYDMERKKLCGEKEDEINLAAWSRSKRKALEPYQFACIVETNPASSHLRRKLQTTEVERCRNTRFT